MLLLLFDSEHPEKLPDSRGCNHQIVLITAEDKLRMAVTYQLSQEQEKVLVLYFQKIMNNKKIRSSSSSVRSIILSNLKSNGKLMRL